MIEFIDVCKNFDEQVVLKNINLTIAIFILFHIFIKLFEKNNIK